MASTDVQSTIERELHTFQTDLIGNLRDLQTKLPRIEGSMNAIRYRYIAKVVYSFYLLDDNDHLRADFVNEMERQGFKRTQIEKDLLFSIFRYVLQASQKGVLYERARIYARALKEAVEERYDPARIPELIREAGGIEKLYSQYVENKRKLKIESANRDLRTEAKGTEEEEEEDDDDRPPLRLESGDAGGAVDNDDCRDEAGDSECGSSDRPPTKAGESRNGSNGLRVRRNDDFLVKANREFLGQVFTSEAKRGLFEVEIDRATEPFDIRMVGWRPLD